MLTVVLFLLGLTTRGTDALPHNGTAVKAARPNGPSVRHVPVPSVYQLTRRATQTFHFDFTSGKIDPDIWIKSVDGTPYAGSFQMYTPEPANSYVKHGELYIRPTLTVDRFGEHIMQSGSVDLTKVYGHCKGTCQFTAPHVPPIMSAFLYTKQRFSHSRVEVVAKLPKGDWMWPAIWLISVGGNGKYGKVVESGEIDLMEQKTNVHWTTQHGKNQGCQVFGTNIHYTHADIHHHHGNSAETTDGSCWGDNYHTYWVDWTPDYIHIGVDNRLVQGWTTPKQGYWVEGGFHGNNIWANGGKDAPFDSPYNLILNVKVGGINYWGDNAVNQPYPKPWSDSKPASAMMDFWHHRQQWLASWHGEDAAMKVKSVKVTQY